MPPDEPTVSDAEQVAEMILRLKRAGWSIEYAVTFNPGAQLWVVSGSNGENPIRAEGRTAVEAWGRALEQARALGMLGPA
jgi:hypothetical protein